MLGLNVRHDNPALTMEELLEDNEEFQRKQTEKLHKDLPEIMAAFHGEDESFHDDSDEDLTEPKQNGGMHLKINGNHVAENHVLERELLLDVRNRQVRKMEQDIDEMTLKHAADLKTLQEDLERVAMERQRAIVTLKTNEAQLEKLQNVEQERDDYYQQVKKLNEEIHILKLTISDQDRTIKMLTDDTLESKKMTQYQKDLEVMKQTHQNELSSFNHQLELCLQKCKSFEAENFELEKKIKYLEERNDDMMTQKAATVMKLMTQIQELEDKLLRKSNSDECSDLKQSLLAAKAVEQDLRAELSVKEILEKRLRVDLQEARAELEYSKMSKSPGKLQAKVAEKLTLCSGVQTDAWSVDDNNAQYLRFHEEQMTNLREECETRRISDLRKKDEIIEKLQDELKEVKETFLLKFSDSVDVRQVQQELATSTERLRELRRIHSEHCIPEIQNRDQQIVDLQKQVKDQADKLSALQLSETIYAEKLAKLQQDKETEIAQYQNNVEKLNKQIMSLQNAEKIPESTKSGRIFTESDMTKLLENLARRHEEEFILYEAQINELTTKLSTQPPKSDSGNSELTLELWRKLEKLGLENSQLTSQLRNTQDMENELLKSTESLKEAQGKAARLKVELLNISEKYNKVRDKFKATKCQFSSRLSEYQHNLETERVKWAKERDRWHKEQEQWEKEREIFAKGQELWETERIKREKALLDLQAYVETLKSPQPQEMVDAVAKLYDQLIASMKRQK